VFKSRTEKAKKSLALERESRKRIFDSMKNILAHCVGTIDDKRMEHPLTATSWGFHVMPVQNKNC